MKKLLVDIWNCLFDCYLTVRNSLYLFMDIPYRKVVIAPHVVSIEETIRYIIQSHCSVSRLGDGEIKIANGKALAFQTQQPLLQQKMQEVLSVPISKHMPHWKEQGKINMSHFSIISELYNLCNNFFSAYWPLRDTNPRNAFSTCFRGSII